MALTAAAVFLYELCGQWELAQASGSSSFFYAPSLVLTGVLVVLLCCLVGGMIFFLRSIITPLENIVNAVQRMSEGSLDKPIPTQTVDEIGLVGGHINDLAMNMQEILLYLWNHVRENTTLLDSVAAQLKGLREDQTALAGISADFARMREDNEELKSIVHSFSYFEVILEKEKMFSDPVQENVAAQP